MFRSYLCISLVGAFALSCTPSSEEDLATVDRLIDAGHEVTWLDAPTEEAVPTAKSCPSGWLDTSTNAIKCGFPTVLVTKNFGGTECATCEEPVCNGPWVSINTPILCAPGFDLKLNQAGTCQRCTKVKEPSCAIGGCSGELCYDPATETGISTCIFKPEFACYADAECGNFGPGGSCAWNPTDELTACIEAAQGGTSTTL